LKLESVSAVHGGGTIRRRDPTRGHIFRFRGVAAATPSARRRRTEIAMLSVSDHPPSDSIPGAQKSDGENVHAIVDGVRPNAAKARCVQPNNLSLILFRVVRYLPGDWRSAILATTGGQVSHKPRGREPRRTPQRCSWRWRYGDCVVRAVISFGARRCTRPLDDESRFVATLRRACRSAWK
jgi:hypothetical protein